MFQHISQFQSFLKENKAAAAFLRLPENLVLFSQYWPRYGYSFIFIPVEGEPTVICPNVEVEDTEEAGVERVVGIDDVLMTGDPAYNVIAEVVKLRSEYNIPNGARIAIEKGENVMAPTFVANKVQLTGDNSNALIEAAFKTTDFIPVRDAIRDVRSIKTKSDLEKLQLVNEIIQKACDYYEELLERPGMREVDVLEETECYFNKLASGYKGIRGVSRAFGQLSTGPERSLLGWAEGIVSIGRNLEKGDMCMLDIGVCVDGYWADLTRTGCVGGFDEQKKIVYDVVVGAFKAGLAAAKDGATGGDVDNACRQYIEKCGYGEYFVHSSGHGTGFAHSEGFPNLEPGSKDVLRTNMVIAIEPGLYIPGIGGIRIEENCVVGPDGARILGTVRPGRL